MELQNCKCKSELTDNTEVTAEDFEVLKYQLSRNEVYPFSIIKRCPAGFPQVILLSPQRGEDSLNFTAFSTPLWLTCPLLNDKIHAIESKGYIKRIEEFIAEDDSLGEQMRRAHISYAYMRINIYKKHFNDVVHLEKFCKISRSGIGGIHDPATLKCLHLHYAHYMVCADNCAGQIIDALLEGEHHCQGENCSNARSSDRGYSHKESEEGRIS
jgi:hypothetical protein